jgi:hypothetical protein
MTPGETFVASVPRKTGFYDRFERRSYALALEIARRIVDDPSTIRAGADHLDRFVRPDPHQRHYYELWSAILRLPRTEIARRLIADTAEGALLRETCPVFVVIGPDVRAALAKELQPW